MNIRLFCNEYITIVWSVKWIYTLLIKKHCTINISLLSQARSILQWIYLCCDIVLSQVRNILQWIYSYCFKPEKFHNEYISTASNVQYSATKLSLLFQARNILQWIHPYCFKPEIFHNEYISSASSEQYSVMNVFLLSQAWNILFLLSQARLLL